MAADSAPAGPKAAAAAEVLWIRHDLLQVLRRSGRFSRFAAGIFKSFKEALDRAQEKVLEYEDELNQLREAALRKVLTLSLSVIYFKEVEERRWVASGKKQIFDDLNETLERKAAELEVARRARDACGLRAILMATAWLRHGTLEERT